ncbi:MAG TPA: histidine kinase, partial [Longimicrobiales bacterium]|nr:histidine kinase [Longimicrobiales bacterium]
MRPPRVFRLWSAGLLLATLAGLLSSGVLWAGMRLAGRDLTAAQALTGVADWYLWAFLAPVVVWLALKVPVTTNRRARGLALHALLGTGVALLELAAYTVVNIQYNRVVLGQALPAWSWRYFATVAAQWLPLALLVYGVIVAAGNAVAYQRRLRREEVRAAELRSRLAQAELAYLRSRLHPHFLFNALNTVAALVREGRGSESVDVLETLSRLLRRALDGGERASVPLAEELDFLEDYLTVERRRMEDRLQVDWSIEAGLDTAPVPPLILQPVVENAVRHGLAPSARGGTVRVAAH